MAEKGSRIQLEWFNVTYRSVISIVAIVALLVGGGVGYWYYFHIYTPRATATEAIERAEGRFAEASSLESPDERLTEVVGNAQVALREAREAYGSLRLDEAYAAAIRSENLSLQAIGMVNGNGVEAQKVRFYRIEGDVRVKKSGQFSWDSASAKMALQEGDMIKTSSKASAQVIYFNGTITTIQPGSLFAIREVYENPHNKIRRVREDLKFGELTASTQGKNVEGSYHEVAAGDVKARTEEATEFRVTAKEGRKDTSFDVFQGKIEVSSGNRRESVVAGERIRTTRDGRLKEKEVLPGVPILTAPRDQKVFILDPSRPAEVTLGWDKVPGAKRYHLMIADRALFTDALYDAEREGTRAPIGEVPEGSYHWKVAAISANGVRGPFSGARRFRVSAQKILDRSDVEPPNLKVTEFVPVGTMVVVNGLTEPGATLWVDNEKIDILADGSFSTVVKLRREGLNDVRFVAQDSAGNETEMIRSAYVELY